jgi:hypothetical protein
MVSNYNSVVRRLAANLALAAVCVPLAAEAGGMLCGIRFGAAMEESFAELRERGPDGLQEALKVYDWLQARLQEETKKLNELVSAGHDVKDESVVAFQTQIKNTILELKRIEAAVDHIGGQRGCTVSRLYWYTDLEMAKAEAARTGRPILSLRMLGKLTDEYSCANSRFFRTALYSNKEVSDFLRTNFVLHWQSVRPVPRVTIDFGDGRKLERTLTGNSAHYVLASDGTPIDVLPGLYSPLAFRQWTGTVCDFHTRYRDAASAERAELLQAFHRARGEEILNRWDLDIQRLGSERAEYASARINSALVSARLAGHKVPAKVSLPNAVQAARRAEGKSAAEVPVLRFAKLGGAWMERGMDDELWQAIADFHREDVKLDEASIFVMRREFPQAADAGRLSLTKSQQEDPILRMVRAFENSIALDTVRNEYLLHRRIHEQFAAGNPVTAGADSLNEWVYAELFLTPSNDPWLGLAPQDVYTALESDGRTEPAAKIASSSGGQ